MSKQAIRKAVLRVLDGRRAVKRARKSHCAAQLTVGRLFERRNKLEGEDDGNVQAAAEAIESEYESEDGAIIVLLSSARVVMVDFLGSGEIEFTEYPVIDVRAKRTKGKL